MLKSLSGTRPGRASEKERHDGRTDGRAVV